jgi:hypothetical protein
MCCVTPTEALMNIITNNIPRPLYCWYDIPAWAQGDFSYIDGDDRCTERFVMYKNDWYDVYDTMRTPSPVPADTPDPFIGWHSYISETFFSGLVFRWIGDEVVVGRYSA